MTPEFSLLVILLSPLLGALLNGFLLRGVPKAVNTTFGTLAVLAPFAIAVMLFTSLGDPIHLTLFPWLEIKNIGTVESLYSPAAVTGGATSLSIPFAITLDRLSAILVLIITGVGSLIHIYAGEYLSHEKSTSRFYAYLNLFVFSMLCLVLGSNMFVTFLGWEGVGLCSWLLIGYWFEKRSNARAGMKAFIVNRIGDLGFLFAMFLAFWLFGTIDYAEMSARVSMDVVNTEIGQIPYLYFIQNPGLITAFGICVLIAVTGKSAQLPLYTWLPDAMAGPTPVSALIHAATMVTAGIYLMTRLSFALVLSEATMLSIAIVGGATALFAASIALVQNDIKKVLAYSTVSQLGFMVLACGVGAFEYAVSHLMTHAFFKALLFLGAGSVIHAMHHEQNILKMGGLMKKMPVTGGTFVVGTLAIIGFPGLSGFFSKDNILHEAMVGPFGNVALWAVGFIAAGFTAFYMVRLTYLTFFGESRVEEGQNVKENSMQMLFPLGVLALLSVVGGYLALPPALAHMVGQESAWIVSWLAPVTQQAHTLFDAMGLTHAPNLSLEWGLMAASVAVMLAGSAVAIAFSRKETQQSQVDAGFIKRLLQNKWYVDEFYNALFVQPLKSFAGFLKSFVERSVVDGVTSDGPKGLFLVTTVFSDSQNGLVRTSLKLMLVGLLFYMGFLLWGTM